MLPETLAWLDVEFVKKVLKISENDESIEIKSLWTNIATAIGDNYSSDMIRASVEYSQRKEGREITDKKTLIFKVGPSQEGPNKQIITELRGFETEIEMMKITLPKMNELVKAENTRLGPRILYADIKDPSVIVMEDLAPLGYRMADRQVGLDLQHCILTMKTLAKFHASSIAMYEKDPSTMFSYNEDICPKVIPEVTRKFFVKELTSFAKALLDWPELGSSASSYSEKFIKLANVYSVGGLQYNRPNDSDCLYVLNHGDCWVNNILFRYNDEGKVDFQTCLWATPTMDIIHFFSTSLSEDVDLHHRDLLLQEYLKHLTETMIKLCLNRKPPNLTELKETLEKDEIQAIIPSCIGLSINLSDKSDVQSMDEMMQQKTDYVNPIYKAPAIRKRLLSRLYAWQSTGILDL